MKKLIFIILLLILAPAVFNIYASNNKFDYANFIGVWANDDCELVQTNKYAILFIRDLDRLTSYLYKIKNQKESVNYDLISIVAVDVNINTHYLKTKFISDKINADKIPALNRDKYELLKENSSYQLKNDKEVFQKLDKTTLTFLTKTGTKQKLKLIEKIEITKPYQMSYATENNIGDCLQEWNLGVEDNSSSKHIALNITTNKHSYTYNVSNNFIYCRAARIRSNNQGSVFTQNIRIMIRNDELTARMEKNNFEISSSDVIIDKTLFNPNMCIFKDKTNYWSILKFTKNHIDINGCGGEIYQNERPKTNNRSRVEWFKFVKY